MLIGFVDKIVSIIKISSGCGLQAAFLIIETMKWGVEVQIVGDGVQKIPPQREGSAEIQAFEQFQAA